MFGRLTDDRHSLLLVAGILLAAAYVSGGAAVGDGLERALDRQSQGAPEPPRLAYSGFDLFASPQVPRVEGAATLRVAHVSNGSHEWTLASVAADGAELSVGDAGLGMAVGADALPLPAKLEVVGRVSSAWFPRSWVLLNESAFDALMTVESMDVVGPGETLLLPPDVAAPPELTIVPLRGLSSFVEGGGTALTAGFVMLVLGSSLVAAVLAAALAAGAVDAHRQDLHLLRSLGASRNQIHRILARWMLRNVAVGLAAGTSAGIVAAYGVFSFGNRLGIRAPVVPAPDALPLLMALLWLGAAAALAGIVAGARAVRRLEQARLEAPA